MGGQPEGLHGYAVSALSVQGQYNGKSKGRQGMSEFMHLVGAEDVSRAAGSMQDAAQSMQSAANSLEYTLAVHQRFMDDWLMRLEEVMNKEKTCES